MLYDAHLSLAGNTITGNTATGGGGVSCYLVSTALIMNTILWDNDASVGDEMHIGEESKVTIRYSDVENPVFVLPDKQDFRLLWKSPCIDTGDPDSLDADGTRSDMGAHYFNQNDCLTLYLTPDTKKVSPGGQLDVTYTAINRWNQPKTFWIVSRVLLPGGTVLDVVGPEKRTLPANYTAQVHKLHDIRMAAPTGLYIYRSAVGLPPSTIHDWDSFTFKVVE